jgi:hypothetical protein
LHLFHNPGVAHAAAGGGQSGDKSYERLADLLVDLTGTSAVIPALGITALVFSVLILY